MTICPEVGAHCPGWAAPSDPEELERQGSRSWLLPQLDRLDKRAKTRDGKKCEAPNLAAGKSVGTFKSSCCAGSK